jgi:hypothetical protein
MATRNPNRQAIIDAGLDAPNASAMVDEEPALDKFILVAHLLRDSQVMAMVRNKVFYNPPLS